MSNDSSSFPSHRSGLNVCGSGKISSFQCTNMLLTETTVYPYWSMKGVASMLEMTYSTGDVFPRKLSTLSWDDSGHGVDDTVAEAKRFLDDGPLINVKVNG